jgi:hypothetical protein
MAFNTPTHQKDFGKEEPLLPIEPFPSTPGHDDATPPKIVDLGDDADNDDHYSR